MVMSEHTRDDVLRRVKKRLKESDGDHSGAIRMTMWAIDRRYRLAHRAAARGRLDLATWHDGYAVLDQHVVRELERLAAVSGD